jgi:rhodanese-related sulfurtransferase
MASSPQRQAPPVQYPWRALLRASAGQAGILIAVAVALSYATIALDLKWSPPKASGEISIKEARAQQARMVWVDVRNPERFENAHIPGAVHFEESQKEAGVEAVRQVWKKGRKLCVYGEGIGSARAERVVKLLKSALETREVYLLEGGWAAWPR